MELPQRTGLPPNWELRWSRTQRTAYCFNTETRVSTWEIPYESDTNLLVPYTKLFSQQQLALQDQQSPPDEQQQEQQLQQQESQPSLDAPQLQHPGPLEHTQPHAQPPHRLPQPSSAAFNSTQFIRCAHLLVKHSGSRNPKNWKGDVISRSQEEAYQKIKQLKNSIADDPVHFRDVVIRESDCSSAYNGGDLGIVSRGQMQPEFENAAYSLEEGQFSDVISSESGFHIIYRIELDPDQIARFQQHSQQTASRPVGIALPIA